MIALSLPWILLILFIMAIFFFCRKKIILGALFIVLCIFVNWWSECIAFRVWPTIKPHKERCFSVLTFNIDGASIDFGNRASSIVELIKAINPDVMFLAEYGDNKKAYLDSLLSISFPFTTLANCGNHYFYSKYPVEKQRFVQGREDDNIGIYMTRVFIENDTINLYGCHFASNNYTTDKHYMTPDSIKDGNDISTYINNIKRAYNQRCCETEVFIEDSKAYKGPFIVMGDMNDVGGSLCVRTLESVGLKDAWWEGGFGYGATIHKPLPYRIDHIMHTKELKLLSVRVIDSKGLSDHDALYAEFELCKN